MSYFVFDGENYSPCESFGEAMTEAREAIDCYADQCYPCRPDETASIAYGVILGTA